MSSKLTDDEHVYGSFVHDAGAPLRVEAVAAALKWDLERAQKARHGLLAKGLLESACKRTAGICVKKEPN